jgi:threonine/homoserine/homoserine lactone efflux protein
MGEFLATWSSFAGIFTAAFVMGLTGAMSPGPLLAFTITSAAKRGPYVGLLIVLGHGILESTLVVLIFVGAATFLKNPAVLRAVGGAGAVVLATMGVMMLRDLPKMSLAAAVSGARAAAGTLGIENPVLGGVVLTALNPTFPVWWAGMGVAMVAKYGTTVENVCVFYAGHITSDLAWYLAVSLVIGHGRQFISDRVYRIFIGICAAALVAFAVLFAHAAITGRR